MNRHLTKEGPQMANKHTKRCSLALTLGEMQIKAVMRDPPHTPLRMAETGWLTCGYQDVSMYGGIATLQKQHGCFC